MLIIICLGYVVFKRCAITYSNIRHVIHLSIVCPTTPCTGRGGGIQGGLLDLSSKTRLGVAFPFALNNRFRVRLALDVHYIGQERQYAVV